MKKTRKTIVLSDGSKVVIRKLSAMDYIKAGAKNLPSFIDKTDDAEATKTKAGATELDFYLITVRAIVSCGLVAVSPNGERTKIVDKPLDQLADDEICLDEMPEADISAIINAVSAFSGEVSQKASPFPDEAGKSGEPSQPVQAVSVPPV